MFKDLTVGNLGPFRDDAMLTMHATTLTEHKGNIVDCSNDAILSSAIIFGPNASGKTSIVGAFRTLQDLVSSFDWVEHSTGYRRSPVRCSHRRTDGTAPTVRMPSSGC